MAEDASNQDIKVDCQPAEVPVPMPAPTETQGCWTRSWGEVRKQARGSPIFSIMSLVLFTLLAAAVVVFPVLLVKAWNDSSDTYDITDPSGWKRKEEGESTKIPFMSSPPKAPNYDTLPMVKVRPFEPYNRLLTETTTTPKILVSANSAFGWSDGSSEPSCLAYFRADPFARDGVYRLAYAGSLHYGYCNMREGGWEVIKRAAYGDTNFNQAWLIYKQGFGDLNRDFWAGNDLINLLTFNEPKKLRIVMSSDSNEVTAEWNWISVHPESNQYKIEVGPYNIRRSTLVFDNLAAINGMGFTTFDRDNDAHGGVNCANAHAGGFWFYACHYMNPNGELYGTFWRSILFFNGATHVNIRYIEMMLQ